MRIVFAVHGYKPAWRIGGPIISVSSVAERLVRRGHEVSVVTSNSNLDTDLDVPTDTAVDVDGVKVYYFEHDEVLKRFAPRFSYLSKSIGFLYSKRMRPRLDALVSTADIVHTHLPFNYPTYAAAHAAFRYYKPLFYHQRGVFDPARLSFRSAKKRLYLDLVEKPILRRATTLIALTEAERQSYALLGVETPCSIIPNGVDAAVYSRRYDAREMARLGIREQDLVVLFMGRIHPIKGADILLDAFADLRDRVPSAILVLAGPDEFGLEQRFKQKAASAGLSGRVLFPGMVEGTLKLGLLGRADLFCLPSAAEGFSMAVLEALASHTAVLLSPGCNFSDVVAAGAGRICDRTVEAIRGALEVMLADRNELRSMGDNGRTLVESRFTWSSVVDQLLDVYEKGVEINRASTLGVSHR
jgi:glycosyltransferase involved in cell wall biosynthesis